jgi:HSP20 family molecular chaperone IbpA
MINQRISVTFVGTVGTVIVRATRKEEEISEKRDRRRRETEMGDFHLDHSF